MSKKYLVMTSEILISWSTLEERLKSYYSLSLSEAEYLINKTKLLFKGLSPEDVVVYDYRLLLKRNLYEELNIMLDRNILKWISSHKDVFDFVLITNIRNYRAVFKENLRLFDKIFCSHDYGKHLSDELFLKVIYSYCYHDTKNPRSIHVMTSLDYIAKKFKDIDYALNIHIVDAFFESKDIKTRKSSSEVFTSL